MKEDLKPTMSNEIIDTRMFIITEDSNGFLGSLFGGKVVTTRNIMPIRFPILLNQNFPPNFVFSPNRKQNTIYLIALFIFNMTILFLVNKFVKIENQTLFYAIAISALLTFLFLIFRELKSNNFTEDTIKLTYEYIQIKDEVFKWNDIFDIKFYDVKQGKVIDDYIVLFLKDGKIKERQINYVPTPSLLDTLIYSRIITIAHIFYQYKPTHL